MVDRIEPVGALGCSVGIGEALRNGSTYFPKAGERRVLILVPDNTRDVPCREALEHLLPELEDVGVEILIAAGSHESCTPKDLGLDGLGVKIRCHNAFDEDDLVTVSNEINRPVVVNRLIATADLIICIGIVKPHHFAGYSGGLKGILPGAAGMDFIKGNHAMRDAPHCEFGSIAHNPIRNDIERCTSYIPARKLCLNFVRDKEGETHWWFGLASEVYQHWNLGDAARICYNTPVLRRYKKVYVKGDACESSNLYQTTRWIAHAGPWLKEQGTMILLSDCKKGIGCPYAFLAADGFRSGIGRYIPDQCTFKLKSTLTVKDLTGLYCEPYLEDLDLDLDVDDPDACFINNASYLLPIR